MNKSIGSTPIDAVLFDIGPDFKKRIHYNTATKCWGSFLRNYIGVKRTKFSCTRGAGSQVRTPLV